VRKLKGLEDAIGMTAVDPIRDDETGWAFRDVPGASQDPVNGFTYLREAYTTTDPKYRGRVTVPVLWDKKTRTIVSNSDDDIMRMLETEFDALAASSSWGSSLDLYPLEHRGEIDTLNEWLYETLNNGVYKAGFATSQQVYEREAYRVFETLDKLEQRLATRRYLVADHPVESDWRAFVTLIRFDAAYYGHFKCNLRRIVDYPNLWGYLRDLYQTGGVAETVNFDHIKRHYYYTHDDINPTRIVPIGPILELDSAHHRDLLR
jgi:putative glutathione S-transferase